MFRSRMLRSFQAGRSASGLDWQHSLNVFPDPQPHASPGRGGLSGSFFQEVSRLFGSSKLVLIVDITALVLNEDLAAEVEQAPLGRHEYFPELPPRLWHGLFRVQPLLAAGSDIATGAGLDYKVDLLNFLPG